MSDLSFYMEGTNGKGVLLVHGLTGAPAEMKFVGKHLNKLGFTVYAPLLAGHGKDEKLLRNTNYKDWVESIKQAALEFKSKISEMHFAGICVGGQIALLAAAQNPGLFKSAVIYSSTLRYDGWNSPLYFKLGPAGLPIVAKIPFLNRISFGESHPYGFKSDRVRNAIMKAGIEGTLPTFSIYSLNENFKLNRMLKKMLPKIKIPTLLIHAREDDVSHPRNAEKIKSLHGGECEIFYLDDSYHMIHVDQERSKVARLSAEFFGYVEAKQAEQYA